MRIWPISIRANNSRIHSNSPIRSNTLRNSLILNRAIHSNSRRGMRRRNRDINNKGIHNRELRSKGIRNSREPRNKGIHNNNRDINNKGIHSNNRELHNRDIHNSRDIRRSKGLHNNSRDMAARRSSLPRDTHLPQDLLRSRSPLTFARNAGLNWRSARSSVRPVELTMSEESFRIELDESSGPVSPKFQYELHVVIVPNADGAAATIRHRTAKGLAEITHSIAQPQLATLMTELVKRLPLGKDVDLIADLRKRKGISFNYVRIDKGTEHARVDYTLSQLESGAQPDLTAAVEAIKAIVTEAKASSVPSKAP
jgi:hypothetical protein